MVFNLFGQINRWHIGEAIQLFGWQKFVARQTVFPYFGVLKAIRCCANDEFMSSTRFVSKTIEYICDNTNRMHTVYSHSLGRFTCLPVAMKKMPYTLSSARGKKATQWNRMWNDIERNLFVLFYDNQPSCQMSSLLPVVCKVFGVGLQPDVYVKIITDINNKTYYGLALPCCISKNCICARCDANLRPRARCAATISWIRDIHE